MTDKKMIDKKKLNGSAHLLADALRATIQETLDPVIDLLTGMEEKNVARFESLEKRTVAGFDEIKSRQTHHQKALDGLKEREARS